MIAMPHTIATIHSQNQATRVGTIHAFVRSSRSERDLPPLTDMGRRIDLPRRTASPPNYMFFCSTSRFVAAVVVLMS